MPSETEPTAVTFDLAESERLALALALTRGERGFTEDEAKALFRWMYRTQYDHAMLESALAGRVGIDLDNGEVRFPDLSPEEKLVRERVLARAAK